MSIWKFHFVTFGCKVNQYETQSLREAWQAQGGVECDNPAEAAVICINSCAITARGERDARNALFRLRREAPTARLILTGCAAKLFADFVPRADAPQIKPDVLVPQEDKSLLLQGPWSKATPPHARAFSHAATQLLPRFTEGEADPATPAAPVLASPAGQPETTVLAPKDNRDAAPEPAFPPFQISHFRRARPVLKVQDGCAHRCTYCIVPFTRGKPCSRAPQDILAEARRLLRDGHAEIMISGVNLRQYGRDRAAYGDFWQLLDFLDAELAPEFTGKARLRLSSLEPSQLDARGLRSLTASRLLCPHLHISLQHASQSVLKRMGRGHYTAQMLVDGVQALSAHWPVMGLGADIIMGFPQEREEDVQILLDLVHALPLSYAHVFPYSMRPRTAAARMGGQIPKQEKMQRAARIRAAVARNHAAFMQAQLALPRMWLAADVVQTIHDDKDPKAGHGTGLYKAVNEYYAPCLIPAAQVGKRDLHGLLPARPLEVTDKGLLVTLL